MNSGKELFTIGEFKTLCMTTRETLYHYEKMGLLCPTVDETNGYRYYTPFDYYTFMYIIHLTRLGFSLNEVHQFLEQRTMQSYIDAIATSSVRISEKIDALILRKERMQRGYEAVRQLLQKPLDRPQITYRDTVYYLKIPFDNTNPVISDVECSHQHDLYAMENNIDVQRHYHGFYAKDPFSGPKPVFDYSLSKLTEYRESDRLLIQPKGMYISMCYHGPFHADTTRSYQIIRDYLEEHRYTPLTGMFVDAGVSPFYTNDETEFLAELSIRIE